MASTKETTAPYHGMTTKPLPLRELALIQVFKAHTSTPIPALAPGIRRQLDTFHDHPYIFTVHMFWRHLITDTVPLEGPRHSPTRQGRDRGYVLLYHKVAEDSSLDPLPESPLRTELKESAYQLYGRQIPRSTYHAFGIPNAHIFAIDFYQTISDHNFTQFDEFCLT